MKPLPEQTRIPVDKINLCCVAERHSEALSAIKKPGDTVLVVRGQPRTLVMNCPCGCNEPLTINLDMRVGPAWRFYKTQRGLTVYPSIWKESGCRSHFIIWNSRILWCSVDEEFDSPAISENVEQTALEILKSSEDWMHYRDISEAIEGIPWEVLVACRKLVASDLAEEGFGKQRGTFKVRS